MSFKENMKNISKFLKLLKTQIVENFFERNMLEEIFTSVPKYSILQKEKKKQKNKPNITQLIK